jgi:uncharacterized SAM-binding protein YcdF (DUF218 family)
VIFGAAVKPDGRPSGSLQRRVDGAVAIAETLGEGLFLATGGQGRFGAPEANVIRDLLMARGVQPDRILLEDQAHDTLESVRLCDAILRARGDVGLVVPCTSGYHLPRCALLFRLLGYPVRTWPMPGDRPHLGGFKWLRYVAKEVIALPYDAVLLMLRRRPAA